MNNEPDDSSTTASPSGNKATNYPRKGGTNPAAEAPKKMRGSDVAYIDGKRKKTFIKGHAMNVHRDHMDIVRNSAVANRRKVP